LYIKSSEKGIRNNEMNNHDQREYQTVIMAALLHDVGKFYQRGKEKETEKHTSLGEECFEDHFRESLSHIFTIEEFNIIESGIGSHHDYAKYVTQADCFSAGLERINREDEEKGNPSEERFLSIFDEITLFSETSKSSGYSYNLKPFSIDRATLFPVKFKKENLKDQYAELWSNFTNELKNIPFVNARSYMNTLYALLEKYTWCIPSATYEHEADISLFDHAKTTAAFAGCLFYHEKAKSLGNKKFLLIAGDLSGIQNFIYRITKAQGVRGISKRLRGRSFYLLLLQDVMARYIIERIGLFKTNILFCGGGRFELLLPNTDDSKKILLKVKEDVNDWLLKEHGGELGLVIESVEADEKELSEYGTLMQKLDDKLSIAKKKKFLSSFQNNSFWTEETNTDNEIKICKVCGVNKVSDTEPCFLCELHKRIGSELPDLAYLVHTAQKVDDIKSLPISFDKFGTVYMIKKSDPLKDDWFKFNEVLDIQKINNLKNLKTSFRFIGNTAPVARERFSIADMIEDEDMTVKVGDVLSFEMIADASIGDKRLGILKMDVDFLGLIFAIGLADEKNPKRKSISKITTLSRSMDMFFGGYLNEICNEVFEEWKNESKWEHKDKVSQIFYIVYSGGDDLMIVGPWSEMPKLAKKIRDEFKEYTCNNPDIDISAGIFFCKPKYPISLAAKAAGKQLEISKDKGRKRTTVFGDTVEWSVSDKLCFDEMLNFGEQLYHAIAAEKLPRGFVHGLLRKYKQYNEGKDPNFIPAIIYQLTRNIKDDELMKELRLKLITHIKGYRKNIKIPASYALLKSRKEE